MAGKFGIPALVSIGLAFLNLCAFFLLLGGASALQKHGALVAGLLNTVNQGPGTILAHGDLKPVSTAGNFISYEWYKAVFQVLTILFALGALATGQVYRFRLALVGLFAALGVLFSDSSNTFYYLFLQTHNNSAVPHNISQMINTFLAGCIASATLNFLLVISLGTGTESPLNHGATRDNASGVPHAKDQHNGAAANV